MRHWSAALAGLGLIAAACGGHEEPSGTTAARESETMGSEQVAPRDDVRQRGSLATRGTEAGIDDSDSTIGVTDEDRSYSGTTAMTGSQPGSTIDRGPASGRGAMDGTTDSPGMLPGSSRAAGLTPGATTGTTGSAGMTATTPGTAGTRAPAADPFAADTSRPGAMAQGRTDATPTAPAGQTPSEGGVCPADVPGLAVRVQSIPRGGALVFTADRAHVQDLRDRLRRFAETHQSQTQQASAAGAQGEASSSASATSPSGTASATGTQGTARVGATSPGALLTGPGTAATAQSRFADSEALIHQASDIRVVEIARGARLEVRLEDRARVADLRDELREDASQLSEGRCPLALQLGS